MNVPDYVKIDAYSMRSAIERGDLQLAETYYMQIVRSLGAYPAQMPPIQCPASLYLLAVVMSNPGG